MPWSARPSPHPRCGQSGASARGFAKLKRRAHRCADVAALIRRSVLFTPGDNEARMMKALTLGADTVCFDLEDAVSLDRKEAGRELVAKILQQFPTAPSERCVRINALQTDTWRHDLIGVMRAKPDAIMLPKAEDASDVARFCDELRGEEVENGMTPGDTRVLLVVETAKGVLNAEQVGAAAGSRLGCLMFGAEDLAADTGIIRTRENWEVLYGRSRVALAAAALRVPAVDQVFVDFRDPAGCEGEARQARHLGYSGKMAIHPDQLAPIHRAFTPTQAEVERAYKLLQAAQAAGGGVFQHEGRMIDAPLVEQARRVVAVAQRAAALAKHGL